MNEIIENIMSRRSCREFTDKNIKKEDLDLILKAAINAPSGMNKQTWQFTVISNKTKITELCQLIEKLLDRESYNMYNPKVLILASNNKENVNGLADCACALQNMFLAATSIGIGSCWINQLRTICDENEIRDYLDKIKIPNSHKVWGIAALGYPAGQLKVKEKDSSKIVFID
jgi:nitroreductase